MSALPPAIHEHFAALNEGNWRNLSGAAPWASYDQQPLQAVTAGDIVAVRSHFRGTTGAGTVVEIEPLTVFALAAGRIVSVAGWQGEAVPAAAVIGEYFRSSNEEDWDAFAQVWAPDGALTAVGGPPRRGRDDVVRAYRLFLGLFGRHEDHVQRIVITGSTAAVTGRFAGTNPQGVEIEFAWADVIDLSADARHIEHLSHWHDRDVFRRLLAATGPAAAPH